MLSSEVTATLVHAVRSLNDKDNSEGVKQLITALATTLSRLIDNGCIPTDSDRGFLRELRKQGLSSLFSLTVAGVEDFVSDLKLVNAFLEFDDGKISEGGTTALLFWLVKNTKHVKCVASSSDSNLALLRRVLTTVLQRVVKYQMCSSKPKPRLHENVLLLFVAVFPDEVCDCSNAILEFLFYERKRFVGILEKVVSKTSTYAKLTCLVVDFAHFLNKQHDTNSKPQTDLLLIFRSFRIVMGLKAMDDYDRMEYLRKVLEFLYAYNLDSNGFLDQDEISQFFRTLSEAISGIFALAIEKPAFGSMMQLKLLQLLTASMSFDSTIMFEHLRNVLPTLHKCNSDSDDSVVDCALRQCFTNIFEEVSACRKWPELVDVYCKLFGREDLQFYLLEGEASLFFALFHQMPKQLFSKIFNNLMKSAQQRRDAGILLHLFLMHVKCSGFTDGETIKAVQNGLKIVIVQSESPTVKILMLQLLEFYARYEVVNLKDTLSNGASMKEIMSDLKKTSTLSYSLSDFDSQAMKAITLILRIRDYDESGRTASSKKCRNLFRKLFDIIVGMDSDHFARKETASSSSFLPDRKMSRLMSCGHQLLDAICENIQLLIRGSEGADVVLFALADMLVSFRPALLFEFFVWEGVDSLFQIAVAVKLFAKIANQINVAASDNMVGTDLVMDTRGSLLTQMLTVLGRKKAVRLSDSTEFIQLLAYLGYIPFECGSKRLHAIFTATTLVCLLAVDLSTGEYDDVVLVLSRYLLGSLSVSRGKSTSSLWTDFNLVPLLPVIFERLETYDRVFGNHPSGTGRVDSQIVRKVFLLFETDIDETVVGSLVGQQLELNSSCLKYNIMGAYLSILKNCSLDPDDKVSNFVSEYLMAPLGSENVKNIDLFENDLFLDLVIAFTDLVTRDDVNFQKFPFISTYLHGLFSNAVALIRKLSEHCEESEDRSESKKELKISELQKLTKLAKFVGLVWKNCGQLLNSEGMNSIRLMRLVHVLIVKFQLTEKDSSFAIFFADFVASFEAKDALNFCRALTWSCDAPEKELSANLILVSLVFEKHFKKIREWDVAGDWTDFLEINVLPTIVFSKGRLSFCMKLLEVLILKHRATLATRDKLNLIFCFLADFTGDDLGAYLLYSKLLYLSLHSFTTSVGEMASTYFSCVEKAVQALHDYNPDDLQQSELADSVGRIIVLIGKHSKIFGKMYRYFILNLLSILVPKPAQKSCMCSEARASLTTAILRLFTCCDQHTLAYVKLNAPASCAHLFAQLFDEFTRIHEYKGQI